MEFSVGGPKWESIAASEERREEELKARSQSPGPPHLPRSRRRRSRKQCQLRRRGKRRPPQLWMSAQYGVKLLMLGCRTSPRQPSAAALADRGDPGSDCGTSRRRRRQSGAGESVIARAAAALPGSCRQLVEKGVVRAHVHVHVHMRACVRACVHGRAFTPRRLRNECATARRPNDGAPARRQREAPATQRARRRGGGDSSQPQPQPVTT